MRTLMIGVVTLSLCIATEAVAANGGSGTRRSLRSSDAIRAQQLRRNSSRSTTRRRSLSSTPKRTSGTRPRFSRKSSTSQQHDAKSREIVRKRIVDALQAEILKNPGNPPNRERMREIARQQLKQAQAEGLLPENANLDASGEFLSGKSNAPVGGSVFGGAGSRSRSSPRSSRSRIHLPGRRGMYVPSRNRIHTPKTSRVRSRGSILKRRVPQTNGPGQGLGLPDLSGGKATGGSPGPLQRQLQKLLQ